jgi:HPt (histidine-containing phosphotransfer) domain-containing protein
MTLKEFYDEIGVDVSIPLHRFANSEKMLDRFVKKVAADPTYDGMKQFMAVRNWAEAFRAAHTLKGVSLNMELTPLAIASQELTEYLRHYETAEPDAARADELFAEVTRQYERVMALIEKVD